MKHSIEWIICSSCGAYIYPPTDVSEVGVVEYEEVFEVPPANPRKTPTPEELSEINRARREAKLPEFRNVGEWVEYYRDWAVEFRRDVEARAKARLEELTQKLEEVRIVEEDEAFRIRGRRYPAVYEPTEKGWRLKCPICSSTLLEWSK